MQKQPSRLPGWARLGPVMVVGFRSGGLTGRYPSLSCKRRFADLIGGRMVAVRPPRAEARVGCEVRG